MFRILILTVLLLTIMGQVSMAQGNLTFKPKSIGTATRYSAFGTIIPSIAGGAILLYEQSHNTSYGKGLTIPGTLFGSIGIVAGPGMGHAYAGQWGHFVKGSLFRAAGAGLIVSGLTGFDQSCTSFGGYSSSANNEGECRETWFVEVILGSVIYLWSTIHDFRYLDDAVEQYNEKHSGASISMSPTYFTNNRAPGIVVSIRF